MNDFLEELLELCLKRMDASRSVSERNNWRRLAKKVESLRGFNREVRTGTYSKEFTLIHKKHGDNLLYRYALWAAWIMNNRSPFGPGVIRKSHKVRPKMAKKKRTLPNVIHARMILANNPIAKEYVEWISKKPNLFERPIR